MGKQRRAKQVVDCRLGGIGYHIIRNNIISDHGCAGIMGRRHTGVQMIGNYITRTNDLRFEAAEQGGIKTHRFDDGLIADNFIIGNYDKGIWLDAHYPGSRATRNVIANNEKAGLMIEMASTSDKLLIDNNIIVGNGYSGIYGHDASGATITNNLIANNKGGSPYGHNGEGFFLRTVTNREPSKSNNFYSNLVLMNSAPMNVLYPLGAGGDNAFDYNVYTANATDKVFFINRACQCGLNQDLLMSNVSSALGQLASTDLAGSNSNGAVKMTFRAWQTFWKSKGADSDQNSIITAPNTVDFNLQAGSVSINMSFDPATLGAKPITNFGDYAFASAETFVDFNGNPVPTDGSAKPGPFQDLKQGANTFTFNPDAAVSARRNQHARIQAIRHPALAAAPVKAVSSRVKIPASWQNSRAKIQVFDAAGRLAGIITPEAAGIVDLKAAFGSAKGFWVLKPMRAQ
jgi:parallel beta-helix repeat protein